MKKKPGPRGPRKNSAASLYRKLIAAGKTNTQIWSAVQRRFPKSKNLTVWYRWKVRHG
jgi:hypothetical protein